MLQAAEKSQQRGERRRGKEAIPHYQQAVERFQRALELGLDGEKRGHAQVLCAESLQGWAQSVLAAEACLPDEEQSLAVEAAAKGEASQLYQQAIQVITTRCLESPPQRRPPCFQAITLHEPQ